MASNGARVERAPTLFSEDEWARVQSLLRDFHASQLLWLSGYLAGSQPQTDPGPATAGPGELLVAYGSETGNSQMLARQLAQSARQGGHKVRLADIADLKPRHLKQAATLALICSTHGDGEPPVTAHDFHEDLLALAPGSLKGLRFAVLALGDSSYEQFCQAGRELDKGLERAGGKRLLERVDCDVDFEKPAEAWAQAFLSAVAQAGQGERVQPPRALHLVQGRGASDRNAPLSAELLETLKLSHAEREDGIWHLVLGLDGQCVLRPGDALAVLPCNSDERVDEVLRLAGLPGERVMSSGGERLRELLRRQSDLVVPGKALLERWAAWHGGAALFERLSSGDAEVRRWLKTVQIPDLLREYPIRPDPEEFLALLRPLQPRLYDIANADGERPAEVELTVKRYLYTFGERQEVGVASSYLLQAAPGDRLRVYPHGNPRFHLPEDAAAPLILIAAGTGIAPYRAFIEQLRHEGREAPVWIAFQEQQYEEDFLYQREWQEALAQGQIERFDCTFLNDRPERSAADLVREQDERLAEWLGRGAHMYLAGEKSDLQGGEGQLREHIDQTLPGGLNWKALQQQGRLHRNLY